jgi:hypothetical protein
MCGLNDVTVLIFVRLRVTVLTVLRMVRVPFALNLVIVLRAGQHQFFKGPEVLPKVALAGQAGHRLRCGRGSALEIIDQEATGQGRYTPVSSP